MLHYVEAGAGVPLILLHGFMEWSFTWHANLGPLAAHARVLALDLRGHGLSGRDRHRGHSLDDQVEVVCAFMDRLGIGQAVLCGHSMGGEVSLRMAMHYPERVRALVLVAATGYRQLQPPGQRLLRVPGISHAVVRLAVMNRRFAERALRAAYKDPDRVTAQTVAAYLLPVQAPGATSAFLRVLRDADFGRQRHRLSTLSQPSLLIWGQDDPVVPLHDGERLAAELPESHLEVYPDCGHLPHAEYPERFHADVAQFLARVEQRGPAR
ncbi:MAG TPA: alpha/beta fold hydrolase [Symbiobacteriaceae bacterium]|nr:alpha/beta fold hydrolase [Symbiobacteriaceae bacterium]